MLVVEPIDHRITATLSLKPGFEVVCVEDPERAIETVLKRRVEFCVILALSAADLDLCKRIRGLARGAVLPILMVAEDAWSVTAEGLDVDAFVDIAEGPTAVTAKLEMLMGRALSNGPRGWGFTNQNAELDSQSDNLDTKDYFREETFIGGVAPEVTSHDAIEKALDAAQAMGSGAKSSSEPAESADQWLAGHESTLQQLIDQVDSELPSTPRSNETSWHDLTEELDALDFEAELGRPDRTPQAAEPMRDSNLKTETLIPKARVVTPVSSDPLQLDPGFGDRSESPLVDSGGTVEGLGQAILAYESDDPADPLDGVTAQNGEETRPFGELRESESADRPKSDLVDSPLPVDDEFEEELVPIEEDHSSDDGVFVSIEEIQDDIEEETVSAETPVGEDNSDRAAAESIPPEETKDHSGVTEDGRVDLAGEESGDLTTAPVWSLLASAFVDRRTGILVLTGRKAVERRIYILDGDPVMATSTAREDRLVELLYREGRLNDEQHNHAAFTVGSSGRRVGAILVENGLIASRELFPLVRHHYESIIFDSFSWREGYWSFEEGTPPAGERILLDVSAPMTIVEGIRSRARIEDVLTRVPLNSTPYKLPRGICELEDVGLLPEEISVFQVCDGSITVAKLAEKFDLWDQELCRMFAGLKVLGLLAVGDPHDSVDPGALPQERIQPRGEYQLERARVADKLAQVEEGTYFTILEISMDASGYEIRKVYRSLRGQFAPERFAVPQLADLRDEAGVIRRIIDEAYEVLRNPVLRESYRQALQETL